MCDSLGFTALHLAAAVGDDDVVAELLNRGAFMDIQDFEVRGSVLEGEGVPAGCWNAVGEVPKCPFICGQAPGIFRTCQKIVFGVVFLDNPYWVEGELPSLGVGHRLWLSCLCFEVTCPCAGPVARTYAGLKHAVYGSLNGLCTYGPWICTTFKGLHQTWVACASTGPEICTSYKGLHQATYKVPESSWDLPHIQGAAPNLSGLRIHRPPYFDTIKDLHQIQGAAPNHIQSASEVPGFCATFKGLHQTEGARVQRHGDLLAAVSAALLASPFAAVD